MNWQAFTIVALLCGFTFLVMQRADPQRRSAVRNFAVFVAILILVYVGWRRALVEGLLGLGAALIFNALFWVLIGRYNPAESSDDIRVLGMDD